MISHDWDAHCDTLPYQEPPYHEQLLVMQEFEETHNTVLKQQGAIEALHNLSVTLSVLMLRDDVKGDYLFGLSDALEVTKRNLAIMKGGVA